MKIAFRNFRQINCCLIFHGHDCTITMSRKNNSLSMMNKVSAAMPFQADQETGLCSQTQKQPLFVHVVFVEGCEGCKEAFYYVHHIASSIAAKIH